MARCYLWCALLATTTCANALPQQQPLTPSIGETASAEFSNLPLVVWHGLGDSYQSDGQHYVDTLLNQTIGPTYTYHIRLSEDSSKDRKATFLGDLTHYLEAVCQQLSSHPILSSAPAINALGFSQGGQFIRAYVERCNKPRVANLVTFGSQHNGISEFQKCESNDWVCRSWVGILKAQKWTDFVQRQVVPAQYFRDAEDLENYLENSNFLADVNNEREEKNETYKENMKRLEKFAMYMFEEDTTVIPKESAYFWEVNGTSGEVTKLRDRELYREDWIGLRDLDKRERLEFRVAKGGHMQFAEGVLEECFERYFKA